MPAPPVVPVTSQSSTLPLTIEMPAVPVLPRTVQRETATFSEMELIPIPPTPEIVQPLITPLFSTAMPSVPLPSTTQSRTRAFSPNEIPLLPLPCTVQSVTVTLSAMLDWMPMRKALSTVQLSTTEPAPTPIALPAMLPAEMVVRRTTAALPV